MQYDSAREARLKLLHQRHLTSLFRKEATADTVDSALALARDENLPNLSVEFRLPEHDEYQPGRWQVPSGLGAALENYMARLREMEMIRFETSVFEGLADAHQEALRAVISAAETLSMLGWPVNYGQNVQTTLEPTSFGLRDGKLVDRFESPPSNVSLGDELLLLGTVTFFEQERSANGLEAPVRPTVMTPANRHLYEGIQLHLCLECNRLPRHLRYVSEWIVGHSGTSYRIAI